jgi:type VI secretion system secreted protein VgrG
VLGLLLTLVSGAAAAAQSVPLGTADSFAVLAGSGITNTGPTTVRGDLGTYPTTTETGTASITITGTDHAGDAVTQGAKNDLVTAYTTAAGEGPTTAIAADLAGQTLAPGVYNSASSIGLSGALTLNGGGNPNAIFVFQAGSTLTTGSASQINLINGAQSCNVFWQVGSSATLGTGSTFRGTIIALTSISVTTGVTVDGRVLARNGAVTLDTDTITRPTCAAVATTTAATTTTAAATTTTAATTTAVKAAPKPAKVTAAKKKAAATKVRKALTSIRTSRTHAGFTG